MIKGAIFDVDGTLLDSMGIWEDVGIRFLNKINIKPENNLKDVLFSMSLNKGAEYITDHYKLKMTSDQVIDEIINIVDEFYSNEVQLKKGAEELLLKLYLRNVPMTIATSSDSSYIIKAFERLHIRDYFSKIITCRELATDKNDPKVYIKASEDFNCPNDSVYVFEDAYHAAKTAHEAGFKVIGIYDETSKNDIENMKKVCDIYLRDFSELDILKL